MPVIFSWGFQTFRNPWAIFEFQKPERDCSLTSVRLQRPIGLSGLSWVCIDCPNTAHPIWIRNSSYWWYFGSFWLLTGPLLPGLKELCPTWTHPVCGEPGDMHPWLQDRWLECLFLLNVIACCPHNDDRALHNSTLYTVGNHRSLV